VTTAGKDRLGLNPPSLGLSVYRRAALEGIGWFHPARAEDLDSTLALTRAGWSTRFVAGAGADNLVVSRPGDYWRQHLRWARDLLHAARPQRGRQAPPTFARRLETWMFVAGYLDRVLLLGAAGLAAVGALPVWVPAAYLALRGLEVMVALLKARVGREAPSYLLATSLLFTLDVLASFAALFVFPWRQQRVWRSPRRAVAEADAVGQPFAPGPEELAVSPAAGRPRQDVHG
jgi:cellulose synthase/poly-beta-1,6-N-acetylglucosamine synthase-like glycosyltransferase